MFLLGGVGMGGIGGEWGSPEVGEKGCGLKVCFCLGFKIKNGEVWIY